MGKKKVENLFSFLHGNITTFLSQIQSNAFET